MKFVSLEGDFFEGNSPSEVLQQYVYMQSRGKSSSLGDPLDEFILGLEINQGIIITTRDKNEILEQLQDQGFLLRLH